jgi:membrane-bound lytic murein transglycosylase B
LFRGLAIRLFAVVIVAGSAPVAAAPVMQDPEVRRFVDEMVARHDLDAAELAGILSKAKVRKPILDAIRRPAEAKPWHEYRTIFVTAPRVEQGVEFWNNAQDWLAKAEDQFGVPAEIIVGILGVETYYGAQQGKFRVLDALVTLAFNYPERGEFFRGELEHFLLLVREEKIDPLSLVGSYAGAIGKPQFIPSSYRRYAVDFDGDGKKDLVNSVPDAIGSVANYFKNHHWRSGQPVIAAAKVEGDAHRTLLEQGLKPHTNLTNFAGYGVSIAGDASPGTDLGALVELETATGREYWVGLQNFYVITRYNRSPLYAMAVYQLAQEVRTRRDVSVARN